ncbi:ferritin-like domain-containing protein [Gillisia hiemivivida]|uniref:Ferritin-like domain-containing protein n=1 Tax=Gillisia hiemivivida TaxID=291190 RepID=A0A5C6ZPH4_9FLAO|nr:ferritin-like domain-containing protein [Gillisia hiemivivida]TXD92298.1 ferritin-like domain-containing protein [Gillisia hiemivivida]
MKKPMINVQSFHDGREGKMNSRRKFLKIGGLAVVGSSLFLYSCEEDGITDEEITSLDAKGGKNKKVFNLGTGDLAILNFAYILEQLEAAFYANVVKDDGSLSFPAQGKDVEIFNDIYQHELIHRDFFEVVLNSLFSPGRVAPKLEFDFNAVDFSSRDIVLAFSQLLEDTGVQAYNGAGNLIENPTYLLLAGKIVSVEARHAAAIRDLILPDSTNFASGNYVDEEKLLVILPGSSTSAVADGGDDIDGRAYDQATEPRPILEMVAGTGFIDIKKFITNNIPTE